MADGVWAMIAAYILITITCLSAGPTMIADPVWNAEENRAWPEKRDLIGDLREHSAHPISFIGRHTAGDCGKSLIPLSRRYLPGRQRSHPKIEPLFLWPFDFGSIQI